MTANLFKLNAIGGHTPLKQRANRAKVSVTSQHIHRFYQPSSAISRIFVTVRLMHDRWWPGFARFIKKLTRYADALETGADGKTDLVDTYRGWAWLPRIGEMFLTMNLRMNPVRHGARTDISRSGVPTV